MASDSAIVRYYNKIKLAGDACKPDSGRPSAESGFVPDYSLPTLDRQLIDFFDVAKIELYRLGDYLGRNIKLLNLSGNPRTRTTKTFASLVMVARAIAHIRATGESVLIVTPTSGNKGGALRDAVARAIECKIIEPHQLRIAIVVPKAGLSKLWSSSLSEDPVLRRLNPVFSVEAEDGALVKQITRAFVHENSQYLKENLGLTLWHTYDLNNYRMADAVRAFFELDHLGPARAEKMRVQAQAVSSAFGLLGHQFGLEVLSDMGVDIGKSRQWLLVQHLGTPDLVLDLLSRECLPEYEFDSDTGLYTQATSPFFPARTYQVNEIIDSTFYSRNPMTRDLIREILSEQGGSGIVVSLYECLHRYPVLRKILAETGLSLPADPRDLREWSMTMVLTGVLNAIDRNLVPRNSEIVVHVTGSYGSQDFTVLPGSYVQCIAGPADVRRSLVEATGPAHLAA
ncbi:hypothetical protein J6524_10135 [Bradyrhizobium sp. WSM 1738]|uniref:DUF6002 family protein n=1 Tax=Bradyrhizobium hereditatis TaxID=2821405 RepID=UPI001CE32B4C|nr:DUF6002 family protein [Bradyrhizobium hereditatis]MCA6115253.1 hypothetical protein [Bradyrhizobium hereditatis]